MCEPNLQADSEDPCWREQTATNIGSITVSIPTSSDTDPDRSAASHTAFCKMLSLFTRRVALSAHSSTATYRRVLPSPALILRARTIADTGLHIVTARTFTGSQRNASTKATAKTKETKSSTKPVTAGRVKVRRRLTPEQKAALKQVYDAEKELERRKKAEKAVALKAKQKARAEKEKEAAARKRKQLAEMKKKKLADAKEREKEKKKAKEAKKPERAYIMVSFSREMSY